MAQSPKQNKLITKTIGIMASNILSHYRIGDVMPFC